MCVCILACGYIFVSVCVCVCKSELHIGEYRDWCSYIFLNNSSISFLRQGLFLDQELTGSGREADQQALGIVLLPSLVLWWIQELSLLQQASNLPTTTSPQSPPTLLFIYLQFSLYSYLFPSWVSFSPLVLPLGYQ